MARDKLIFSLVSRGPITPLSGGDRDNCSSLNNPLVQSAGYNIDLLFGRVATDMTEALPSQVTMARYVRCIPPVSKINNSEACMVVCICNEFTSSMSPV